MIAVVLALWMVWGVLPRSSFIPVPSRVPHRALSVLAGRTRTTEPPARASLARIRLQIVRRHLTPTAHWRLYEVQWGDTLWAIAQHFDVSLQALVNANRLHNSFVLAGTILRIPESPNRHTPISWNSRPSRPASQDLIVKQRLGSHRYHLSPQDLQLLARLVQSEAGNQPYVAQVAVAAVVLNRMRTPGFPHTVAAVIFAPGQFEAITSPAFQKPPNPVAVVAVRAAAAGWDPTGGALYFYNPYLAHVAWMNRLPKLEMLGSQIFCR
jgi:N-acetylmuramoyl-L-alanine amidase